VHSAMTTPAAVAGGIPFRLDPERLQRHQAFVNRALVERPLLGCCFGFYMPQMYPRVTASLRRGQLSPEDIRNDLFLADCDRLYELHRQVDDDFPFVAAPFISVPWMEAIMGCPIYASDSSIWAEPAMETWDSWRWERPTLDNPWARKLLELMAALVTHAAGRYPVAPTLMRGPSDIVSALRGGAHFPFDFYDCPDTVRAALTLCTDTWIRIGKAQLARVPLSDTGYLAGGHGLRTWAPDKVIWLQESAMALLSPRLLREFILPETLRIARAFPHTAFHLHGSALWSVDDLVQIPEFDVLQLNYDSARCDVEGTFAGWRKIQRRKPLVIWRQFDAGIWAWLDRVLAGFSPVGLAIQVTVADVEEALAVKEHINQRRGGAA